MGRRSLGSECRGRGGGLNDGFCLVGCFLTTSAIQFQAMQNKHENLWHLPRRVAILDITEKRYLFKFSTKLTLIK
ncbi:hypothetical protein J1N35_018943 [Gossypium stocksii]|uniref:DUF4283 domain-containing protein n=1 Tax=Gossypium stocksii TaxID=47602 RepID=A0A9D3VPZ9_9ROSI|nr:hypothetical protein J1N35_018943 [Gossypium stocksii]